MNIQDAIRRKLETEEWIDTKLVGQFYSTALPLKHSLSPADQLCAYFLESVYTAITHQDPMIAFRACLQAYAYGARMDAEKAPQPFGMRCRGDLVLEARNRIESFLKDVPRVPKYPKKGEE